MKFLRALAVVALYEHVVKPLVLPPVCTWLRKERWFTTDVELARRSLWQWGESEASRTRRESAPTTPTEYGTSVIGVINGLLPRLGVVLTVINDEVPVPPYIEIRRKWW